ncbi:hypothetical protein HJC23_005267 [Cyclotella cryptica]|uniref:Uncharacterized protein n=1 Tax=Cyclotella cryptica TaxID=29204 RepID=A0ABD3PKS5_9STRA|eukprot:CCRYP_013610-RA/>CCRYP_013610-RA protein AED:0.35 eAED:0.35 QI:0/-1/0/1/-1/1/1/0/132
MKNCAMNVLLILTLLINPAFAARLTATSYSHAASTWNSNAHRRPRFGRRRAVDSRYNTPNAEAILSDQDWENVLTETSNSPAISEEENILRVIHERDEAVRIAPASARAALVAIVSAAAIGCARHAVEMVCL